MFSEVSKELSTPRIMPERQAERAGEQARNDQILVGVGGEGFQGVDLFADAHRCDFGGHGAAHFACDHESAEDGGEFSCDGENDEFGNGSCCEGIFEAGVGLQDENHT